MPSGDPDMESVKRVAIRFEVNGARIRRRWSRGGPWRSS